MTPQSPIFDFTTLVRSWAVGVCTLLGALTAVPADAAGQAERPGALRVFLDCAACPSERVRREIAFINWVRDRADAQLHVLGTLQEAGAGGIEYAFAFIGLKELAGRADTLRYVSSPTNTQDETWTGLVHTLQLGLVRYVAGTPLARQLRITFEEPPAPGPGAAPAGDPWHSWVFSTSMNGSFSGEQQQSAASLQGSLSAKRTTAASKLSFSLSASYQRAEFTLPTETVVSVLRNYGGNGLAVWSLGPHWSTGLRLSASTYDFLNQDLAVQGAPALEYSVFPYEESSRRQLTVLYSVGLYFADYADTTIFEKTRELLPEQTLGVTLRFQQPWGSATAGLHASQFLHDLSKHQARLSGSLNVRLVRGLSLAVTASIARIKDQIYLGKAGLTSEEILLRQRELGTDYRYSSSLGFSYTFGSVFSNVVNPRM